MPRAQASFRRPPARRGSRPAAQRGARGFATLTVVLFLIATLVFALSQLLLVSSGNVADGQRQMDSTAAFLLAESGLEKARAGLSRALSAGYSAAGCTALATGYALGRGSVSLGAVSTPAACDNAGATACTTCTVTAEGRVGGARRTLAQELAIVPRGGVGCSAALADCRNNPTRAWQLDLRNPGAAAGVGLFVLGYRRQGGSAPGCAGASACLVQLQQALPTAGGGQGGLLGVAVAVPGGTSQSVHPAFAAGEAGNPDLVAVGGLFLGEAGVALAGASADAGAAAYWDRRAGLAGSRTVGSSGSASGGTSDGTAADGGACAAPTADHQSCTSWCLGGDTLVFSFAAAVAQRGDQLGGVTFGTNAGVGQNVALTRLAKFPSAQDSAAPAGVDAELWWARNPNLSPAARPLAENASSYKGRGAGAVGAAWTSAGAADTFIQDGTLNVGEGFGGYPAQLILPGDTVSAAGVAPGTVVVRQLSSAEPGGMAGGQGGRGTYEVSAAQNVAGAAGAAWTVSSRVLNVANCGICFFASADAVALPGLEAGRRIAAAQLAPSAAYGRAEAAGGPGRYPLGGAPTRVAPSAALYAGTPGATLYLPAASSQPALTTPPMLLAVKSGTGALLPGTTVTAVDAAPAGAFNTTAFAVSSAPAVPLDGATLCAGACAFFVAGGNTLFSLSFSTAANFRDWAGGFTCLKGVDAPPQAVSGYGARAGRWSEAVQ